MRTLILILCGHLAGLSSLKADCANSMIPLSDADVAGYIIATYTMGDSNGKKETLDPYVVVGFCEGSDYVIDIFYLATKNQNKMNYLLVHELVLVNASAAGLSTGASFVDVGWQSTADDSASLLTNVSGPLNLGSYSQCGQSGDFTRSVQMGSGTILQKKGAGGSASEIDLCLHHKSAQDTTVIKYDIK
jgi:hypothetical protein